MTYQTMTVRAETNDDLISKANALGVLGWYIVAITQEYTTDASKTWLTAWLQKETA